MSTVRLDLNFLSGSGEAQAALVRLGKIIAEAQREKKWLLESVGALKSRLTRLKTANEKLQRKCAADTGDETLFLLRQGEELQRQCEQLLRFALEQTEAAARGEAYLTEQKRALECMTHYRNKKCERLSQIVARYKSVHAVSFR